MTFWEARSVRSEMFIVPREPKMRLSSFRSGRFIFRSSGALAEDKDEAINIALLTELRTNPFEEIRSQL